jgi:hypothetical protein
LCFTATLWQQKFEWCANPCEAALSVEERDSLDESAISSDGTRRWAEEAVILIEVYAAEVPIVAVIQSGPAEGEPHSPVHRMHHALDRGLSMRPRWMLPRITPSGLNKPGM